MKYNLLALFFCFFSHVVWGQQVKILAPEQSVLNTLKEGEPFGFPIQVIGNQKNASLSYEIIQGKQLGMSIDSTGMFTWTPAYSAVDRLEGSKIFQIQVEVRLDSVDAVVKNLEFRVAHVNRPPQVGEMKPFYVQYNTTNKYTIDPTTVFDEDNDPIVLVPYLEDLPEGMKISSQGEVTWSPSVTQFNRLKKEALYVTFYAIDQPAKTQSKGRIRLVATQMDLPPSITAVPKNEYYKIRENETLNLRFYLSDPNGDDDVATFDFLTPGIDIAKTSLIRNTPTQYEFVWQPGYDFVKDPRDSLAFNLTFFVLDNTQNRTEMKIRVNVVNTINEAETDAKLFNLYRATLLRGWELMEQLKEKENELKRAYNRAKKGKRSRSVVNASLGATTSLSSIIVKNDPTTQRAISTIGGTTVLTIGTLEATEVIGRSMKDLVDRLNYVIEKKNELQTKGDIFARDYSLKSTRRQADFLRKVDDLMTSLNLKGLVALELDSTWEAKSKPTDENIKRTFKDYNPAQ